MAKGSSSFSEFKRILEQLKQKQFAPVYLLQGDEYYFMDLLLDELENNVLTESTKSFNHHVMYGKDSNVNDILNLARRFPMMSDFQLIEVKEAHHLRLSDAQKESLVSYIENPVNSTILVWYHPTKKVKGNTKLGVAFRKHVIYNAEPISDKEIISVVNTFINEKGYDIEPKPLHLLVENSAGKFSVIVRELEKVFSNVEPGNKNKRRPY